MLGCLILDDTEYLRAMWFNQPFMQRRFREGQRVIFSAKPKWKSGSWRMSHPQITWLAKDETRMAGHLLPIYPLTEGISQYQMRGLIRSTVDEYARLLEEVFPQTLLDQYRLWSLQPAVRAIHQPENDERLASARRRFIFQELFILQLALSIRRSNFEQLDAPPLPTTPKIETRIRRLFAFELTPSQGKAIAAQALFNTVRRDIGFIMI